MCKFKRGDVLWGVVVFGDRDGVKSRPVIVLKANDKCWYLVVECNSEKEKHKNMSKQGMLISTSHSHFTECGFNESTFIHCHNRCWIPENLLLKNPENHKKPAGYCSFIDEVENYRK